MYKLFCALSLLSAHSLASAAAIVTLHNPGVTAIDVRDYDAVVQLRLIVVHPLAQAARTPRAVVEESLGGFSCSIAGVQLESSAPSAHSPEQVETYLIDVAWQPGADISSCLIAVTEPLRSERYTAELYMDFGQ